MILPEGLPPHWYEDCAHCGNAKAAALLASGEYTFAESLANPMWLCPECGNKRCPRAMWHGYKCTGSNEPNQVGEMENALEC